MSTTPTQSTDVVEVQDLEVVARALRGEGELEVRDPETVQREIVSRILQAQTVEDVFNRHQPTSWRELLGVPLSVLSVSWHRSAFEESLGVFAIVAAAAADTGEVEQLVTGGANVCAQLLALQRAGALPIKVRLVESDNATAAGYKPLWLDPA